MRLDSERSAEKDSDMPVIWMTPDLQEQADEMVLAAVLDRQRVLADLELAIAEMIYRARSVWINGLTIPWGMLTPGQRAGYRMEAKALIQEAK